MAGMPIGALSGKDRKRIEAIQIASRVRLAAKDPNIDNIITDAEKVIGFLNKS